MGSFALGGMAEKRALPLAQAPCPSLTEESLNAFHSVAKEATYAIENMQKGNVGHGHGCIFCVRRLT